MSRFIGVGGASLRPPWALTFCESAVLPPQPQHIPEWRLGVVWRKVPSTQWRARRAVCSQPSALLIGAGPPELSGAQLRPGEWDKNSLKGEALGFAPEGEEVCGLWCPLGLAGFVEEGFATASLGLAPEGLRPEEPGLVAQVRDPWSCD